MNSIPQSPALAQLINKVQTSPAQNTPQTQINTNQANLNNPINSDSFENSSIEPIKEKTGFFSKIKNLSKKQKTILALSALATAAVAGFGVLSYLKSAKHAEIQANKVLKKSKEVFKNLQKQISEALDTIEQGREKGFAEFENSKGNIVKFTKGDEDNYDIIEEFTKNGKLSKKIEFYSDDGSFDDIFSIEINKKKNIIDAIIPCSNEIQYHKNVKQKGDNFKVKEFYFYEDNKLQGYIKDISAKNMGLTHEGFLYGNKETISPEAVLKYNTTIDYSDNTPIIIKNETQSKNTAKAKLIFTKDSETGKFIKDKNIEADFDFNEPE